MIEYTYNSETFRVFRGYRIYISLRNFTRSRGFKKISPKYK